MSEYIVNVPDEEAKYFIARFGSENVKLMGYSLTDEIVRCRDCKWFDAHTEPCLCYRLDNSMFVDADGFCAWGELRDV